MGNTSVFEKAHMLLAQDLHAKTRNADLNILSK